VLLAAAVAGTVGSAPWLTRPAGVQLVTGTASPVEVCDFPIAMQLKPRSAGTRMVRE